LSQLPTLQERQREGTKMTTIKRFAVLTLVLVVTALVLGTQFSPRVQAARSPSTGTWSLTGSLNVARDAPVPGDPA